MHPRPRRRTNKPERQPALHGFARRLAGLRQLLAEDAASAGDQGLKMLEELLEFLAHANGYEGEGSLRRYSMFLRGKDVLEEHLIERIDSYTDARNCLAHTYGLQTTPEFAAEIVDFLALLMRGELDANRLMTSLLRTIYANESMATARSLMLTEGYGRLPVVDQHGYAIGILTERDVVAAQVLAEQQQRPLASIHVAEALPSNALQQIAFVAPNTSRTDIERHLHHPDIIACLVTDDGTINTQPIGIITHADLLYRS